MTADGIVIDDIIGRLTRTPGNENVSFYQGDDRGFNVTFERSIRAFVEKVQGADNPATTGQDGYAVLEIEHGLLRSQAEGRDIVL